jgi:alkylation response protein AidB-like acyl-CoA dehydrogenase
MAILTEEQTLLKDQAKAWVREQAPVATFRAFRNSNNPTGFAADTWAGMTRLGWPGIIVPEEFGGSGMDCTTFGVVLEETGRGLTASPLLASSLIGASALLLGGSSTMKKAWLPGIASGTTIVTLALDEGPHHAPLQTALAAEKTDKGFRFSGKKVFVAEGMAADALIVATRTSDTVGDQAGITLLLVPANTPGIARHRLKTADSRGYADIDFTDVHVSADAVLGQRDNGFALLDAILDRARAGLAAEMLGTAAEAFDRTLEYLKTRVQFGQPIGSFQALGHRAARLFMEMELSRSCVEAALAAIDDDSDQRQRLCSLAKCQVGDFLHHMSNDMIQMHGGIGMTDEFDAGLFIKRARATEAAFGSQSFHRDRYIGGFGI